MINETSKTKFSSPAQVLAVAETIRNIARDTKQISVTRAADLLESLLEKVAQLESLVEQSQRPQSSPSSMDVNELTQPFELGAEQTTQFESAEQVLELAEYLRKLGPGLSEMGADMLGILLAKVMLQQSTVRQAEAERDAANKVALAQNAKLMAMTDHPNGFKLLTDLMATCEPASVKTLQAEADAWKCGYTYLQGRMQSLDRPGWATDCDGEIAKRIDAARRAA